MDRINKFLNSRQEKNQKTVKYKNEKFTIKKEDLKTIRAYKSGKCLDPSIKNIPSRQLSENNTLDSIVESIIKENIKKENIKKERPIKKDNFNKKLLEFYSKNPIKKIIKNDKNEIFDIWNDQGLEELKTHTQEWTYSITEQYEGKVEELKFTKEFLEEEIKKVYLKYFRPRDLKIKPIRNILPKIPKLDQMKPFPEFESKEWKMTGKKYNFGPICCSVEGCRVVVKNLKFDCLLADCLFEKEIIKLAYCEGNVLASTTQDIYLIDTLNNKLDNTTNNSIIHSDKTIKDIYIDRSFIGLLTSKSIHLYDSLNHQEVKILKLKGDTPHSLKIKNDIIYSSTHKGIMVDSIEKSEIKNLGYVMDFAIGNDAIYVINNLGRLLIVDLNLKVVGNTVQSGIGIQIRYQPEYDLIAILFTNEIGLYKVIENQCIPLNTISGSFRSIDWDECMPWLYASQKGKVVLFT